MPIMTEIIENPPPSKQTPKILIWQMWPFLFEL